MTFTISEFWCGVIATVIFEVVSLTIYGVYITKNHKLKEPKNK